MAEHEGDADLDEPLLVPKVLPAWQTVWLVAGVCMGSGVLCDAPGSALVEHGQMLCYAPVLVSNVVFCAGLGLTRPGPQRIQLSRHINHALLCVPAGHCEAAPVS
jgi:hypothetical protein